MANHLAYHREIQRKKKVQMDAHEIEDSKPVEVMSELAPVSWLKSGLLTSVGGKDDQLDLLLQNLQLGIIRYSELLGRDYLNFGFLWILRGAFDLLSVTCPL